MACLFGDVVNRKMVLNDAGKMVENEWLKLPKRFENIALHEYIVMPNHFHAILEITTGVDVGATPVVAPNDVSAPNTIIPPNTIVPPNTVTAPNNAKKIVDGSPEKG